MKVALLLSAVKKRCLCSKLELDCAHFRDSFQSYHSLAAAVIFVLCLFLDLTFSKALAAADDPAPYRLDRVIVRPKAGKKVSSLSNLSGIRVRKTFVESNLQVIDLPPDVDVAQALDRLQQSGLVEFAEPDYLVQGTVVPNDPAFQDNRAWGLNDIQNNGTSADCDIDAAEGWNLINSAPGVIVAIIDTGVRYTHQDLAGNMWRNTGEVPNNGIDDDGNGVVDDIHGVNAITGSGNPMDDHGHGTHAAGILGAVGNNGIGVTGVAWKVQIMACKFLDSHNKGAVSDAIECINYARSNGAQIINASWTISNRSIALRNTIDSLRSDGILFVAAAGNEQANLDLTPRYPACYDLDNIVSVAASNQSRALDSNYSNYGATTVDLAAPGTWIYSTWGSSDAAYDHMSGTSMATPYVTGSLALMYAYYPGNSYKDLKNRLLAAADPSPSLVGKCITGGILNLRRALGSTVQEKSPPRPGVLQLMTRSGNSGMQMRLRGEPGRSYVLQASVDFRLWTDISTNMAAADGYVSFWDPNAGRYARRYYRGISLP